MDKFFSVFGKVMLVALLVGGISYAAYYVGRNTSSSLKPFGAASTTAAPAQRDTPTAEAPVLQPDQKPTAAKTASTVTAGLDASSGLSFTKYQITIPEGWTPNHTTTNEGTWVDTLTLIKGPNQIKIFQAATGGAMCLYPSDPSFEGPSAQFDTFTDLTTADGTKLRRGTTTVTNGQTRGYTMCQKGTESFGQPTVYGHMSLTTPVVSDPAILTEADAIISSLKKL